MATITLELPDDTPVITLMRFAAQIGCEMKLVEHNRFRLDRTESTGSVVRMPARVRPVESRAARKA
ncbi:hypothetical protein HLV39_12265 [Marinobacter adhaerens]|uniref:Uncharacterized protein n=1 Tax=Marinobacter adhaerens TaxID=1033846 RepID=A0A851HX91_9GAMM|nr:hypothetical protein [Marinobacter adhaerens]NWN92266.1 hypothetical protein [Marinobacter adhaerens]